jgi:hypothetical protein
MWAKQIGGTNDDFSYGITADASGNCFVTGYFSGNATFGPTNLTSSGITDGFIAKFDSQGNLIWVTQAGGSGDMLPTGIVWQSSKGVFFAGSFTGEAAFGTTVLSSSYDVVDLFLARVDEMPILAASRTAGAVSLSWPTNQAGFTLEKAAAVGAQAAWSAVTNEVDVSGDRYVVMDQMSSSSSFYRLWKP